MPKRFSNILLGTVLGSMLACAGTAQAASTEIPLDRDFRVFQVNWQNDANQRIYYTVRELQGMTFVCGVYTREGGVSQTAVRNMFRALRVRSGSTVLKSNLSYFKRVDRNATVGSVKVPCRSSNVPWNPAFGKDYEIHNNVKRFEG